MANKILTGATYHDEVRAKLGVDATVLSDTDIDARSVLPIAENKVIASVSDFASLTGDNADYCYAAAVCMVAASLAPSMAARIKKSEGDSDYKFENGSVNWRQRAIELIDEAYTSINLISTQIVTELSQFAVAGPTRANAPTVNPTPISGDIILWNDPSD